MSEAESLKLLLIEDDEDDFIILRDLLAEIPGRRYELDWARNFDEGLEILTRNQHEVCLVDYHLGVQNGLDLLRTAYEMGCQAAVILLTGVGCQEIDLEAMKAGAADYLVKGQFKPDSLERSVRYALQRKRAASLAAFEQARLAAFGTEIGLALTRRDSLEAILTRCATAMVHCLNADLAQISIFDPRKEVFETRARSGTISDPTGLPPYVPKLDLRQLAEGKPVVIKHLENDPRIPDQDWLKRQEVVSYAAYPLVLEERLVGLMSIFTRHVLSDQITQEMGSVANGLALLIERKRSAAALDASEVRYRSVVENISEVIFQLDGFGHWTFLSPAWTAVTGFEVNATLGTFFLEFVHQEDRRQNRHIFLQLIEQKLDYCRYETRFLTKNGKVRWVEVYAQRTLNSDGTVLGTSGSLTDVTDRKIAETQIQKLAAFPHVNPNPVLEFGQNGALTYANDAAHEMANSLGKQDLFSILPPQAAELARESLITGKKKLREEVNLDGRTISWSFFPVATSQTIHCYGTETTEVLRLEAQFRHAQKLESVGQLAAGVAHDFNNLLTVIQGYSDRLLMRTPADPSSAGPLKQISDACRRAAALTRQLLMFSRKQTIQPKVLDLNGVLREMEKMLPRLLSEEIALQADYSPELFPIEADTGMLEQIVMNLAVNARDAMPRGGQLFVGTSNSEIDEAYVSQHPDSRAGKFVVLTVTDTGCGMDANTLQRIFEPFFSTKEVGKGTGLGLATVYGIVKQHQGWIEVSSQLGVGTTFKIYFPVASADEVRAVEPAASPQAIRGGKETILLVEDEPVLRELAREVLSQYDYNVVEAGSGVEALRVWDQHGGQIDLLLTDMVMPEGMTGRDLAVQLRQRKPGLRVIYSSGYSPEIVARDSGDTTFLAKPYLPPQLAQVVRRSLDTSPGLPEEAVVA